jgi:hypothetical protein
MELHRIKLNILIDSRHCSDLFDTQSYRGADIDSDHLLK